MRSNKKIAISIIIISISFTGIISSFLIMNSPNPSDDDGGNNNPKLATVYIAPYVNYTHPCYTHNLVGCTGQLKLTTFNYTIYDGAIMIIDNSSITTESNGFFTLMLNPDRDYNITIGAIVNGTQYNGITQFSTYESSANCITTGQLT